MIELLKFRSADELAQAAAKDFLALTGRSTQKFSVALPGGRIAGVFFSTVTGIAREKNFGFILPKGTDEPKTYLSLDHIHFFWGDERCVPPESPESNFGLARDRLLRPLGIPESRIHRIRGEARPEETAREAEAELRAIVPVGPSGEPVLELVLLGMGEEGHTASLFPGEPEAVVQSPAVFRAVTAPKPPPQRITLGYGALAAARQVWVLVSGKGKERALEESLAPGGRTPLGRLLGMRQKSRIFTDLPVRA